MSAAGGAAGASASAAGTGSGAAAGAGAGGAGGAAGAAATGGGGGGGAPEQPEQAGPLLRPERVRAAEAGELTPPPATAGLIDLNLFRSTAL